MTIMIRDNLGKPADHRPYLNICSGSMYYLSKIDINKTLLIPAA